jgi:hypothetical protein
MVLSMLTFGTLAIAACGSSDGGASDGGQSGSDGGTQNNNDDVCDLPEAEPPSCEACLADECNDAFMACHCDPECDQQLEAMRSCFAAKNSFDDPSDDPGADWEACENELGEPTAAYQQLVSCVGSPYEPTGDASDADDPYNRTEGDDLCSTACFELFALDF